MKHASAYKAKQPDKNGIILYTDEEHEIWSILISQQRESVKRYACEEYQLLLAELNLPNDHIPQCNSISNTLYKATGWTVSPVAALITSSDFFLKLANKDFPIASFIRTRKELKYLKEPDIFHELFGHAPLLMNPDFAKFSNTIGKLGVELGKSNHEWLARLYWFTIEFGLIKNSANILPYGAGIISSPSELHYSVLSDIAIRKPFNLIEILRTPYRIDIHQPIYYVIDNFKQLFELTKQDILLAKNEAQELGLHETKFLDTNTRKEPI